MKGLLNQLTRKYSGIDLNMFDVERIEISALSQNLDTDTFTRSIKVRCNGKWTTILLFGKDIEATKLHEVNSWE